MGLFCNTNTKNWHFQFRVEVVGSLKGRFTPTYILLNFKMEDIQRELWLSCEWIMIIFGVKVVYVYCCLGGVRGTKGSFNKFYFVI